MILVDGREKMNEGTREALTRFGFIDDSMDEPHSENALHCFCSWAQYTPSAKSYGLCNVMVLVKEKNGGKLDTHKVGLDGEARGEGVGWRSTGPGDHYCCFRGVGVEPWVPGCQVRPGPRCPVPPWVRSGRW